MDNHGLLMKFSKIRKKPQQPLNSLAELYTTIARETIHYLELEEKHEYKAAIQGWKAMATDVMYKLNLMDRQYPNFGSYTAEELSLQSGIKELHDKAMKNLERVQELYDTVPKSDNSSIKTSSLGGAGGGKFKVHTLRDGVQKLRYNRNGSGLGIKSEKTTTNNPVNFTTSKSLPTVVNGDPFSDFDHEESLIDLSDNDTTSIKPISLTSESIDYDVDSFFEDYMDMSEVDLIRLRTLNQLEGLNESMSKVSVASEPALKPSKSTPAIAQTERATERAAKPAPPVPTHRKASINQRPAAETKPALIGLTKGSRPVARRNTSMTAAIAASKTGHTKANITSKSIKTPRKPIQTSASSVSSLKQASASSPALVNTKVVRSSSPQKSKPKAAPKTVQKSTGSTNPQITPSSSIKADSNEPKGEISKSEKEALEDEIIESLGGVDKNAAKQIFNEIVVHGDEVHWDDIAGLETAKNSLKEAVVYPFLRPDLFRGLREPVRGMLLFGPPGTGKTMLARAVATESKSTFFSISASSLTSKYLGESEKLVRALFAIAKKLSPSIIFIDEIDSIMGSRNNEGENESSRRIKNEFLVQWSSLSSAAAGKDSASDNDDRVLVLAATNLPWSIDEAARRRFVRRQYIPLPEPETRIIQLRNLLSHQKHTLTEDDFAELIKLTDGYSGSDITSLAKDAAMGPLRELGDKLLFTETENIRSLNLEDFRNSLNYIKPSVSKDGLLRYEEWATQFGSSGV